MRRVRVWHIALVMLLGGFLGFTALRWHWRCEFDRRIAALQTAGFPVTLTQLDASYEWPSSGDNAAHWVLSVEPFYREPAPSEDKMLTPAISRQSHSSLAAPLADDVAAALENHVTGNRKTLDVLHEAGTIRGSRYPLDLREGFNLSLNHVHTVRRAVCLLCCEAVLAAEHGNAEDAVQSLVAGFRIADSLRNEPVVVSQLVRMGGIDRVIASLERTLCRVPPSAEQLRRLAVTVAEIHDAGSLRRAWIGQRCTVVPVFEDPASLGAGSLGEAPPVFVLEAYDALGLADREAVAYLDMVEDVIEAVSRAPEERLRAIELLDLESRRKGQRFGIVLRRFWIRPFNLVVRELSMLASVRAAQVALAIERARLASGELPADEAHLAPACLKAVPRDPFAGEPLRYRRLEPGYVVYSLGPDGLDDGGVEKADRNSDQTCDIGLRVTR